jgi:hypothetical protein
MEVGQGPNWGCSANKELETPEDDPLRVETCSVTQINKKVVALSAKFVY